MKCEPRPVRAPQGGSELQEDDDLQRAEAEQNLLNEIHMRDSEITALEGDIRRCNQEVDEANAKAAVAEAYKAKVEQLERELADRDAAIAYQQAQLQAMSQQLEDAQRRADLAEEELVRLGGSSAD